MIAFNEWVVVLHGLIVINIFFFTLLFCKVNIHDGKINIDDYVVVVEEWMQFFNHKI